MRTTIELSDERRAALQKLAAERGEKGFSRLIGEAVDELLARESKAERLECGRRALDALDAISPEFGEHLHATLKELRTTWRA
ncbi:MAG: hypothetical protein ACKVT1_05620 [Dehalococcoidia bacterium]